MKRAALAWLSALAWVGSAFADEAPPPRQIAPERFAPSYRDAPAASTVVPSRPSAIVAPSAEHPFGGCDRRARDWMRCLDAAAGLGDDAVGAAEARIVEALGRRPGLNVVTREAIAAALKAADEEWRALRERECGALALVENGVGGPLFEARLVCQIRRDLERIRALEERYGGGG